MGYKEAVNDGIKIERTSYGGTTYYPKCSKCGVEVKTMSYITGLNYLCKECKLEKKLADKERRTEQDREKKERQFANAIKRIEKQTSLIPYKKAIEKVHEKLHTNGYFDSTEEIMVAIELVKNKIGFIHQKKLQRYTLDFVIPSEKIVLEVDGHIYHTAETRNREDIRDNLITMAYGLDWEVIRITDKLVNENITKLVDALKEVKKTRKEIREKNNGMLPDWYSDRKI